MPLNKNKIIISCAGSGKTTFIVEEVLKIKNQPVLITTYTDENLDQINSYLIKKNGFVPPNVTIKSWFSFLLQDGVRPYQNQLIDGERVRSIYFHQQGLKFHKKNNYLTSANFIYRDKISEFVFECNRKTNGLISNRLEKIYKHIFIDELQDFAGYDLDILEILFRSNLNIFGVGDPRQATYSTNNSRKNRKFRRSGIYDWLLENKKTNLIDIEDRNVCFRSNQQICDEADNLFPELPKTTSSNKTKTGHDGLFFISPGDVLDYVKKYQPKILRYNKKSNTMGFPALNIGLSKGRTFERVLIFPTAPMLKYLKNKDISTIGDKSKFYVAITRARHSVAFVIKQ